MMANKRWLSTLVFCFGTTLAYGIVAAPADALEVKSAGDISYVSGGVGASEQEALELVKTNYNLRLSFAVSDSGAFLADIPLTITDGAGQVLLEAVSSGPYFYAQVPAGAYRISAQQAGQAQTKSVTVPATGAVSADFRWASE